MQQAGKKWGYGLLPLVLALIIGFLIGILGMVSSNTNLIWMDIIVIAILIVMFVSNKPQANSIETSENVTKTQSRENLIEDNKN